MFENDKNINNHGWIATQSTRQGERSSSRGARDRRALTGEAGNASRRKVIVESEAQEHRSGELSERTQDESRLNICRVTRVHFGDTMAEMHRERSDTPVKNKDFIIGGELTSNQKRLIESYLEEKYKNLSINDKEMAALKQSFESDILNPKVFPEAKHNFINKWNFLKASTLQQMKTHALCVSKSKTCPALKENASEVYTFPRYRPR